MPKKTKRNQSSRPNKTQKKLLEGIHDNFPREIQKQIISYMRKPSPRKGSIMKIDVDRVGRQSMEKGRLGKIIDKNDNTQKLILRLFYNGEDRVLNFSHVKPKGNNKERPNSSYWNPDRPVESWDMQKLRIKDSNPDI